MSKLTHSLEETRSVLCVTFNISLWLHKHTNSLHNVKIWFSAAREDEGFILQICHQLWHITLPSASLLLRESHRLRAVWPLQTCLASHTFTQHTPDRIKQQQGKGWKCGHRLYELWAVSCPVTTNSSLDSNHQQRFPAHTPYPTRLLAQRPHIRGKTLLAPIKTAKVFISCSEALWAHWVVSRTGLPSVTFLPFIALLCCPPGSTACLQLPKNWSGD